MSDTKARPRRPLSAAHPSTHASAASRSQMKTPAYRPLRYVGRGSFGVVLLAEELHTGKKVAIKRVHYDNRLHNREVSILNTVLVDDIHHKHPSSTATEADGPSRHQGAATVSASHSSPSQSSKGRALESVHLWPGRHHPNIVELLDFYVTHGSGLSEPSLGPDILGAEGTSTHLEFLPSCHTTRRCDPSGGGAGAASVYSPSASDPLPTAPYLEMVMGYLPMDLSSMKRYYFRFHNMPSMMSPTPSSSFSPLTSRSAVSPEVPQYMAGTPPVSPPCAEGGSSGSITTPQSSTVQRGCDSCECLPLRWVKIVLFQLARGLAFMHARHVCHRDLKPANVLVDPDSGRVQLCDFGSAKQILRPTEEKNVSYICSRYYRAPELLFGALHYGCAVDMWSFGCIAAELLRESGQPLFRGCTSIDQMAELFKVLGAPSKLEMYAMNPPCAEALLRTHAMHRRQGFDNRYSGPRDGCDSLEHGEYGVESQGEFLRDGLDDDISCRASPSPSRSPESAPAWPPQTSTKDSRHYEEGVSLTPSAVPTAAYDGAPTLFEEYYDVLKVRAIPWPLLFPPGITAEAIALVASLLCYAPKKRLTAAEVVEHPFFDDLFSAADVVTAAGAHRYAATPSERQGASPSREEDKIATANLRMPNGRLMPLAMFQVTELERGIYTEAFLARMARQTELLVDALRLEESA